MLRSRLLEVNGTWQRDGGATSLIAGKLDDFTPLLGKLTMSSRDFQ